jgi:uncharacterized membrane protein YGL010W
MALFSDKSWDLWIDEYSESHQHPVNRWCHSFGIPLIVVSIALLPFGVFQALFWQVALGIFVIGWILQFVGHYYEKKPPEFFRDWRFLLVGTRWWLRKTFGHQ